MNCLVTKLKGAVNDSSLLKMGELRLTKRAAPEWDYPSQYYRFRFSKEETLTIIGDGYFTDKNGTENKGTSLKINSNTETDVYVSNSNLEISVPDKYSLMNLYLFSEEFPTPKYNYTKDIVGGLGALSYCKSLLILQISYTSVKGDLSELRGLENLGMLLVSKTETTGNLSDLNELPLNRLYVDNSQVTGDISILSGMNKLNRFQLGRTEITGDISVAANWTNLNVFYGPSCKVYGVLDPLSSLSKLQILDFSNLDFSGDYFNMLSQHDFERFLVCGTFTYTTKNFSGKTYRRIGGDRFVCINLDAFLNDFQQVNNTTNGNIQMLGTRTSASDNAIAALQEKGFTVTVPEATDAASIMTMAANSVENFGIAYKDGQLVVGPVDLSKQQIYPAAGVTVETFATKEEAERFIKEKGLEYEANGASE